MKLFLRKNRDTDSDCCFTVYTESGCELYRVVSSGKGFGEKLLITSLNNEALVSIRVISMNFFYAFAVKDSKERFMMTMNDIFSSQSYKFYGISWLFRSDTCGRSFEVCDLDSSVVMRQKADKFITNGVYELDIFSESRELFCIATAVCADILGFIDRTAVASV